MSEVLRAANSVELADVACSLLEKSREDQILCPECHSNCIQSYFATECGQIKLPLAEVTELDVLTAMMLGVRDGTVCHICLECNHCKEVMRIVVRYFRGRFEVERQQIKRSGADDLAVSPSSPPSEIQDSILFDTDST
ncbi:MAG: hypothetical protein ABGZ53_32730 [Fuerstiella sp.]